MRTIYQYIFSTLAVSAVAVVFVFTLQLAFAAWTEPGASPPGSNASEPLNVSTVAQTKQGDLTVARLLGRETASAFEVYGNTSASNGPGVEFWGNTSGRPGELAFIAGNSGRIQFTDYNGVSWDTNMVVLGNGNVGIGTTAPGAKLEVAGQVKITGGTPGTGKVLTSDASGLASWVTPAAAGVGGSGTDNYIPRWNGTSTLENSVIYQTDTGNVGVGTATPAYRLDVAGDLNIGSTNVYRRGGIAGVSVSCGAGNTPSGLTVSGGIVTSAGTCTAIGAGLPAGTSGQTLRHDGTNWVANSNLYNNGTNVGIGTTAPGYKLHVVGSGTTGIGAVIAKFNNSAGSDRISIIDETTTGSKPPGIRSVVAGYGLGLYAQAGPLIFYQGASDTEAMRIIAGGNVGIGTTAPAIKLAIGDSDTGLQWLSDGNIAIYTNNVERMRIKSDGRIGVNGDPLSGTTAVFQTNGAIEVKTAGEMNTYGGAKYYLGNTNNTWFWQVTHADPNASSALDGRLSWDSCGAGVCTLRMVLDRNGNFSVTGAKSFLIPHPLDPKNKQLQHAAIEGPEAAVFYRGEGSLVNGEAIVTLPAYFEALTRKEGRTVLLTAKGSEPYLLSSSDVVDGKFRVYGTKKDGEFFWEVKAVRVDIAPLPVEINQTEAPLVPEK